MYNKLKNSSNSKKNKSGGIQKNYLKRILLLLKILSEKSLTKKEILDEFLKNDCKISIKTLENYIEILKTNKINLEIKKNKNLNLYSITPYKTNIKFTKNELETLSKIKKFVILKKNHNLIRQTMVLFYKLALHTKDEEDRFKIINFDYYSKINWNLVKQLEQHCQNKDIITIDYVLANGKNMFMTLHADSVYIHDSSNRIYLYCVLDGEEKFSKLPVDRIFKVEKIVQKNVRFNMEVELSTYKIKKENFNGLKRSSIEKITKEDDYSITITRPLNDYFEIVQDLLFYCPDLYYISDNNIKNACLEKLSAIKANYE